LADFGDFKVINIVNLRTIGSWV